MNSIKTLKKLYIIGITINIVLIVILGVLLILVNHLSGLFFLLGKMEADGACYLRTTQLIDNIILRVKNGDPTLHESLQELNDDLRKNKDKFNDYDSLFANFYKSFYSIKNAEAAEETLPNKYIPKDN